MKEITPYHFRKSSAPHSINNDDPLKRDLFLLLLISDGNVYLEIRLGPVVEITLVASVVIR